MFVSEIYVNRRSLLKREIGTGVVIFFGNTTIPQNIPSNTYEFRQNSNFLYYFGLKRSDLAVVLDIDEDEDIIFGDEPGKESEIWTGKVDSIMNLASKTGIQKVKPLKDLEYYFENHLNGRIIHSLPFMAKHQVGPFKDYHK